LLTLVALDIATGNDLHPAMDNCAAALLLAVAALNPSILRWFLVLLLMLGCC